MEAFLRRTYYADPGTEGSLAAPRVLFRLAREAGYQNVSPRAITDWLSQQRTYTLHRRSLRRFKRNPVIALGGTGSQLQIDLISIASLSKFNDKTTFILICVDVFSKKMYAEALTSKSPPRVVEGLRAVFDRMGYYPEAVQSDAGLEFLGRATKKYLQSVGVHLFTVSQSTKACIAERGIRSLRMRIQKYLEYNNTRRYVDKLQMIVRGYNETPHTSTGIAPNKVTISNENVVFERLYGKVLGTKSYGRKRKFKIGDYVRLLTLKRHQFEKEAEPTWTKELMRVTGIDETALPRVMYRVSDLSNEKITGRFYPEELQRTKYRGGEFFDVEEVIRTRGTGAKKEYFVKFYDYPSSANEWVKAKDIKDKKLLKGKIL